MSNLKHAILAANDVKVKKVNVPEWALDVYLKTLTVAEAMAYNAKKKDIDEHQLVALSMVYVLCDEQGKRLYTEDDLEALSDKNPNVLVRLFYEALALNEMDEEGDKAREEKS